jgi:WD40 repeat protein
VGLLDRSGDLESMYLGALRSHRAVAEIWDASSGQHLQSVDASVCGFRELTQMCFSYDNTRLLLADDFTLSLWDIKQIEHPVLLCNFESEEGRLNSVCFSRDNGFIVTCSNRGLIRVWEASSMALMVVLDQHRGHPYALACCVGDRLISVGSVLVSWSLAQNCAKQYSVYLNFKDDEYVEHLVVSDCGALVGTAMKRAITVRSSHDGSEITSIQTDYVIESIEFSKDSSKVLTVLSERGVSFWVDLLDIQTGESLISIDKSWAPRGMRTKLYNISFACLNGNDSLIITDGENGEIKIWDAQTGQEHSELSFVLPTVDEDFYKDIVCICCSHAAIVLL